MGTTAALAARESLTALIVHVAPALALWVDDLQHIRTRECMNELLCPCERMNGSNAAALGAARSEYLESPDTPILYKAALEHGAAAGVEDAAPSGASSVEVAAMH